MTTLTLNQVIARMESLALSHRQINHFFFGSAWEAMSNGDLLYPAMIIDMNSGSISKADRITGWDFQVWLCDLSDVSSNARVNELEVWSDLTSVAEDYKSMLGFSEYDDWFISSTSQLQYFHDKTKDIVASVMMKIRIDKLYDSNRCNIPSTIEFEKDENMTIINNYIYKGTGTEGNSISVSTLQNKKFLMVFKGDKLHDPAPSADVEPTENQYFHAEGSANVKFGTDIEDKQIIQILYR